MIKTQAITTLLLGFILMVNIGNGQTTDKDKFQFPAYEWNIGVSYFGELILRPGVSVSIDRPVKMWNKIKEKKKGKKYRSLALHLGGRYWNYYQLKSHTGNAIDLEFFLRRTRAYDYKDRIGVLDFGMSAGLGWNKLHGGVYKTTDKGFEKANRRQTFFSYGLFMSFGRNLMNSRNIPIHWYIKPKVVIETPYSPYLQVHPSLEMGINIPFSFLNNKLN